MAKSGNILSDRTWERVARLLDLGERYLPPPPPHGGGTTRFDHDPRVWWQCRPDSPSVGVAPAYGVIKIVDMLYDDVTGSVYFTYEKPDADSLEGCALLWHQDIPAAGPDAHGRCTFEPWWALYNNANTPANGETWGTEANTWKLKKDNTGFTVLGAVDATRGRVIVERQVSSSGGTRFIEFELNEALSTVDATAEADVISFWGGADPGGPVTLANLETSAAGVYVFAGSSGARGIAVENTTTGEWPILNMQCG